MRSAHRLKPLKTNTLPRHCIWFDTETTPHPIDDVTEIDRLVYGWACYRRRHRGNKWTRPEWYRFTTIDQFWLWVTEHMTKRESITLFAHKLGYDITVMDAFNWLPDNGWKLHAAVIEDPPTILKWRRDGQTIQCLDTLNFWAVPLRDLGKSIGLEKLDMPDTIQEDDENDRYCMRDVEIIMQAILNWFDFIQTHGLGGFAATLAAQSMRAFRHRFMTHDIMIDDNIEALAMSRSAYHGGRVECYKIGEITEPMYQVDYNSMYPYLMREHPYPTKLIGVYGRVKHLELGKLLKDWLCVAEVEINTADPVYPVYTDGKLLFPVGTFDTVLTTPELVYALAHGHITSIGHVAVYEHGHIMRDYVDYFYPLRLAAADAGNDVDKYFLKIMMNSLYGKWGQRGGYYETLEQVEDRRIMTWDELDYDTGEKYHYRQFAGQIQVKMTEPESRDSHPAIAAHVTAYGRMMLWYAMCDAGRENVYYTDTDCLLVNQTGYDNIEHMIDESQLGSFKLEHIIKRATIHGPKDYVFDSVYRAKGVRGNALWLSPNDVEQDLWVGLKGLVRAGDLSAPRRKRIQKHLTRQYTKGSVLESGNVEPYYIAKS